MMEKPDYLDDDEFDLAVDENARKRPAPPTRQWSDPKPIPDGLSPVAPFDMAFLPESIAAWVADIAERMQCPPDFVSGHGRGRARRRHRSKDRRSPATTKRLDRGPNLWAMIVGRPGMLKSPAMGEALKPLHQLEKAAREANGEALAAHAREHELWKIKTEAARAAARKALTGGRDASLPDDLTEPEAPKAKRYMVNDTTYEALGEIMADNPQRRAGVPRRTRLPAQGSRPRGTGGGAGFLPDGVERDIRLHVRPHHPGQDAYRSRVSFAARIDTTGPACRIRPARRCRRGRRRRADTAVRTARLA